MVNHMTYVNFDSGISFVINVPDGHKAHTNCTAGGLSVQLYQKNKVKILNEKDVMETLWACLVGRLTLNQAPGSQL
jgi:hypothetical protein